MVEIIAHYVEECAKIFPRVRALAKAANSIEWVANDNIGFMLQAIIDSYTDEIRSGNDWKFQGI
jgi:hypothetical protein